MAITIKIDSENWVKFEGTKFFLRYMLNTLRPLLESRRMEDEIINGPYSVEILEYEIELAREAEKNGAEFRGKYVSFVRSKAGGF